MTETATKKEKTRPDYAVPPVERAFRVLRHIAAGNRCRKINRTAEDIGINRTTLIRLLATLEAERMIEAIPDDGGYRLGTGLITLASQALNERGLVPTSRPVLRELVEDLNLSAHLGVRDGRDIVYLARETPNSHLASMVREGTRLPAHATTIGRILLASLSARGRRALRGPAARGLLGQDAHDARRPARTARDRPYEGDFLERCEFRARHRLGRRRDLRPRRPGGRGDQRDGTCQHLRAGRSAGRQDRSTPQGRSTRNFRGAGLPGLEFRTDVRAIRSRHNRRPCRNRRA